jgi:hypothetical protein
MIAGRKAEIPDERLKLKDEAGRLSTGFAPFSGDWQARKLRISAITCRSIHTTILILEDMNDVKARISN